MSHGRFRGNHTPVRTMLVHGWGLPGHRHPGHGSPRGPWHLQHARPSRGPQAGAAGGPGEACTPGPPHAQPFPPEEEEAVLPGPGRVLLSHPLRRWGSTTRAGPTRKGAVAQGSAHVGTSGFAASALAQPHPPPQSTKHPTVLERSTGERGGFRGGHPWPGVPLPRPLARQPWASNGGRRLRSYQTGSDPEERLKRRRAPCAQGQVQQTPAGPAPGPSVHSGGLGGGCMELLAAPHQGLPLPQRRKDSGQ